MTEATQTIVERPPLIEACRKWWADLVPVNEPDGISENSAIQRLVAFVEAQSKAEIERLRAALKLNLTAFGDAGFVETVTEDTLTIWQEVERPAYLEVGRNADGRIIGLRIHSREIADEILNSEAT